MISKQKKSSELKVTKNISIEQKDSQSIKQPDLIKENTINMELSENN